MRTSAFAGTLLVGLLACAPSVRSADPTAAKPTIDKKELDTLVQEEVQRQLPDLVKAEVKRQLQEVVAQAQNENREYARLNSAVSTMQTIRGQLELYKIQHRDNFPSMADLTDWKVLVKQTDYQGHTEGDTVLGPYIQRGPVNPFTLIATVVAVGTATVKDGWTWDEKKGTLRIVLPEGDKNAIRVVGNDAEVVKGVPEPISPAKAAMNARVSSAMSTLQTMRGQLELYKIQHADKMPTWKQMADWGVLIHATDGDGNQGKGKYGPYITAAPANPFNGKSMIAPGGAATTDTGWTYTQIGGFRLVVTADEAKNISPYLGKEDIEISK